MHAEGVAESCHGVPGYPRGAGIHARGDCHAGVYFCGGQEAGCGAVGAGGGGGGGGGGEGDGSHSTEAEGVALGLADMIYALCIFPLRIYLDDENAMISNLS